MTETGKHRSAGPVDLHIAATAERARGSQSAAVTFPGRHARDQLPETDARLPGVPGFRRVGRRRTAGPSPPGVAVFTETNTASAGPSMPLATRAAPSACWRSAPDGPTAAGPDGTPAVSLSRWERRDGRGQEQPPQEAGPRQSRCQARRTGAAPRRPSASSRQPNATGACSIRGPALLMLLESLRRSCRTRLPLAR